MKEKEKEGIENAPGLDGQRKGDAVEVHLSRMISYLGLGRTRTAILTEG